MLPVRRVLEILLEKLKNCPLLQEDSMNRGLEVATYQKILGQTSKPVIFVS